MNLFGVGPAEAGLILVIAMVLIGPQRFPEIMRQAGRWYRVARTFTDEVMKDVRAAVDDIEKEIEEDTGDLRSIRELTDVSGELEAARKDTEEIARSTTDAAKAGGEAGPEPAARPGPAALPPPTDVNDPDPFRALEAKRRAASGGNAGANSGDASS